MNVPSVPLDIVTHTKKVTRLYKKSLRAIFNQQMCRTDNMAWVRMECVKLRDRIDKNRHVKDEKKQKQMLLDWVEELKKAEAYCSLPFAGSYGELLHERDHYISDFQMDYWHALEKAEYPDYFATREKRKKEFIQMWNKMYGEKHDKCK